MAYNMTQKIICKKMGRPVEIDQIVLVPVDVTMTHETGTPGTLNSLKNIAFTQPHPDLEMVVLSDHFIPAQALGHAENQKTTREFAQKWKLPYYYEIGRAGICHQVLPEKGHVRPGEVLIGTDSHVTTYGALGCMGLGVGVTDMAIVFASGRFWFKMPKIINIFLEGALCPGVTAKDIAIQILHDIDLKYLNYWIVEITGPGVKSLTIESRLCLCNMLSEGGIKTCMVACDEATGDFLKTHVNKKYDLLVPDPDAEYQHKVVIDLEKVVPMAACPHHPTLGRPVSEIKNIKIDQAFIGSCTNGRLEDLRAAAKVLKGRKVAPYVRLIITPATQKIWLEAMKEGLFEIFSESGAIVTNPTCGTCIGAHGLLAKNEICVSTGNRNFPGRMGSIHSQVYLVSPATAAASAISGMVCRETDI